MNLGTSDQTVAPLPGVLRVLCIDDDRAQVRLVEEILAEQLGDGVRVECCARLHDGLKRLGEGGIDAVLLDLTLPDTRGLATYRNLRRAHPFLPVLVVSADADPDTAEEVERDAYARFVRKDRAEGGVLVPRLRALLRDVAVHERARRDAHRLRFLESKDGGIIGVLSMDGRFGSATPVAERLLGWSEQELVGMGWSDLVSETDRAVVERECAAVRIDGTTRSIEVGMRTEKGAERRVHLTFGRDVDGSGILVAGRSVSLSSGALDADGWSVLEGAPVPMVVHDQSSIIRVNRAFLRLIGTDDASACAGRLFADVVHDDDRQRVLGILATAQERGTSPLPTTFRLVRDDAATVLVEGTVAPVEGRPVVAWVLRDVTSQRVAKDRLEAQWRWFRALTRNNADLLVVLDSDWTVRYANRSADLGSYDFEDRTGRTFFTDVHPDDVPRVEQALCAAKAEPGTPHTVRFRVFGKDGRLHWLESVAIDHLGDMDVQGIIVNSRDVTERERSETALRERTEELESLTYAMTHDLKTPLASMDWLIEELETLGLPLNDDVARILDRLRGNIGAMDDLVRDLLQFARIGQRTAREAVDFGAVMARALAALEGPSKDAGVTFEWDRSMFPVLRADETYVLQVFLNLLGNAVKYGRQGGNVQILVQAVPQNGPKAWWRIEVLDEGPGIPEEYIERIFRPFERGPDVECRGLAGTGVGLAIARKVARHYDGDLVAVNRPEGGARFILDLPYHMAEGTPQGM